jgi:hypothetical protein
MYQSKDIFINYFPALAVRFYVEKYIFRGRIYKQLNAVHITIYKRIFIKLVFSLVHIIIGFIFTNLILYNVVLIKQIIKYI